VFGTQRFPPPVEKIESTVDCPDADEMDAVTGVATAQASVSDGI
jgi:hypothetical protein